ncbi:MAG: anthranilate phosphoribosyltransferase [Acidimicrobiales bacterium]|jgi:anthranilate phosphoribosyltransferase
MSAEPAAAAESGSAATIDAVGGWARVLGRLFRREDLSASEASAALDSVLAGEASPVLVAALLAGLRTKGETVEEISGLLRSMRARAEPLTIEGELVDTCGTGGDRSGTINVSTISALVLAAAGAKVCKHGNRAISSVAGSADVLEALGVVVDLGPRGVERCVASAGIGFCLAPRFHPAMRHVAPVRRELGVATIFNFLGPLANPASAKRQVIGVGDPAMAERMLAVLEASGTIHAMVVYGHDGLDELSTVTTSTVLETVRRPLASSGYERRTYEVDPGSFGLARVELADLQGGPPALNAELAAAVLAGETGPRREFVLLNAAAALVVAGLVDDIGSGIEHAASMLDSGRAAATLERLVTTSHAAAADTDERH